MGGFPKQTPGTGVKRERQNPTEKFERLRQHAPKRPLSPRRSMPVEPESPEEVRVQKQVVSLPSRVSASMALPHRGAGMGGGSKDGYAHACSAIPGWEATAPFYTVEQTLGHTTKRVAAGIPPVHGD